MFVVNIKNLKTLKYHTFFLKKVVISIISSKCSSKDEKICKEEESIEILKILNLIINIEEYQKDKYDWRKHKSRI